MVNIAEIGQVDQDTLERPKVPHMRERKSGNAPCPHSVAQRQSHIKEPKLVGRVPVGQKTGHPGTDTESNPGTLHSPSAICIWLSQFICISGDTLCCSAPKVPSVRVFTLAVEGTSCLASFGIGP